MPFALYANTTATPTIPKTTDSITFGTTRFRLAAPVNSPGVALRVALAHPPMPLHTKSPMFCVDDGASVSVVRTVRDAESTAVMTVVSAKGPSPAESEVVYMDVKRTVSDCEFTLVMTVVARDGAGAG